MRIEVIILKIPNLFDLVTSVVTGGNIVCSVQLMYQFTEQPNSQTPAPAVFSSPACCALLPAVFQTDPLTKQMQKITVVLFCRCIFEERSLSVLRPPCVLAS